MYNFPRFDFSAAESSGQKVYSTMQMAVVRAVCKAKSRRRSWSIGESVVCCQKRILGGALGGENARWGENEKSYLSREMNQSMEDNAMVLVLGL